MSPGREVPKASRKPSMSLPSGSSVAPNGSRKQLGGEPFQAHGSWVASCRFRLGQIEAYEVAQQPALKESEGRWHLDSDGPDPDSTFAITPLSLKRLKKKRQRELGLD